MFALRLSVLLLFAGLAGCSDPDSITQPGPGIGQISIDPSPVELRVGETMALRINGFGTRLLAVWSSENPEIASVAGGGFVRGMAAGRTVITARVGEQSASAEVTVRGAVEKQ